MCLLGDLSFTSWGVLLGLERLVGDRDFALEFLFGEREFLFGDLDGETRGLFVLLRFVLEEERLRDRESLEGALGI